MSGLPARPGGAHGHSLHGHGAAFPRAGRWPRARGALYQDVPYAAMGYIFRLMCEIGIAMPIPALCQFPRGTARREGPPSALPDRYGVEAALRLRCRTAGLA